MRSLGLLFLLLGVSLSASADLKSLDDSSLSAVTGTGNGVALSLAIQLNTDSTGAPLSSMGGTNCGNNNSVGSLNGTCTAVMALQFENLGGSWLALKNVFGMMSVPTLQLDAYINPTTNTAFNNSYRFAYTPFESGAIQCVPDISSCNPAGMGTFSFTFPSVASTNYSDIGLYLHIGGMAVEYDTGGAVCSNINSTTCGYNVANYANGSFGGFIMSDATQNMAQISIQGRVRVYGF